MENEPKQTKLTVRKAIRKHCLSCVGGSMTDVHTCGGEHVASFSDEDGRCRFMAFRLAKGRPKVKLIRAFCLECQGQQQSLVRECHEEGCFFHIYRMGKTGRTRNLTDEQRAEAGQRLRESRALL